MVKICPIMSGDNPTSSYITCKESDCMAWNNRCDVPYCMLIKNQDVLGSVAESMLDCWHKTNTYLEQLDVDIMNIVTCLRNR
jgi:hypothetical protein